MEHSPIPSLVQESGLLNPFCQHGQPDLKLQTRKTIKELITYFVSYDLHRIRNIQLGMSKDWIDQRFILKSILKRLRT